MSQLMKISEIVVGTRYRHDLGDIAGLAKSTRELGVLQPILVTPDNRLIAGARRLAAAKELGMEGVPVRVLDGLDDALLLLKAERDENTCRKDLTPSEAVAMGTALEELERPKAEARKREHGRTAPGRKNTGGNLPPVNGEAGKTREKVAEAVGMSDGTYRKAKEVVAVAEAEPEQFGDLAQRMDATGKVDGAYQEMRKRKAKSNGAPLPKENTMLRVDRLCKQVKRLEGDEVAVNHLIWLHSGGMSRDRKQKYANKLRGLHAVLGAWIAYLENQIEMK